MLKTILFVLALSCSFCSFAQSWQWGKRGGTPTIGTAGYGPDEDVCDITTDKQGNVYVITNIWNYMPDISGITFTTNWQQDVGQICIASYKCDGSVRWVKLMSDCGGKARAIKVDTLGHVYVSGYILNTSGRPACRIRSNTTVDTTIAPWPNPINRTMFVMKMDTGGAYKWIRFPEPDTATYHGGSSYVLDMDVDETGNIFLLSGLKPGAYAGGAFVASHSVGVGSGSFSADRCDQLYMLKYNTNGVFQSGYHLPFTFKGSASFSAYYKRDHQRQQNIINGICGYIAGDTLKINGQRIYTSYVTAFDDNGTQLWLAQQDSLANQNGLIGTTENRVTIDNDGSIYYPGWGQDGYSFNGNVVHNTLGAGGVGYIVKMNSGGHNIWLSNVNSSGTTSCIQAAVSGNTLAVWGAYAAAKTAWGTDTLKRPVNCGYRVYLARLNAATGAVIGVDSLRAQCGTNVYPAAGGGYVDGNTGSIAADAFGNFYMGGYMDTYVIAGPDSLVNIGGTQDWYIAKYGTTTCKAPTGINEATNPGALNLKVYPNPAAGAFTIAGDATMERVEVYNMVGDRIYTRMVHGKNTIVDLGEVPAGIYFYMVKMESGDVVKGKVVME